MNDRPTPPSGTVWDGGTVERPTADRPTHPHMNVGGWVGQSGTDSGNANAGQSSRTLNERHGMKPMALIQEECANYRDGRCTGAHIAPSLAIPACSPRSRCKVADGEPCRYFEDCVAPMADATADRKRAAALREAVVAYQGAAARAATARRAAGTPRPATPPPRQRRKVGNPYHHGRRPETGGDRAVAGRIQRRAVAP